MGKYKNGILGPFLGKVGTVVGGVWRGVYYMRALANYIQNNPSMSQLDARVKFAIIVRFCAAIKVLIETGFQSVKEGETPMNAAVSYNLRNAITGVSPNFSINYPMLRYSQGDLPGAYDPTVATAVDAVLELAWVANPSWQQGAEATDMLSVLVYNTDKDAFVPAAGVAARSALEYDLQLPLDFSGDEVQVWYSFVSADNKQVSNSIYVGTVTVL